MWSGGLGGTGGGRAARRAVWKVATATGPVAVHGGPLLLFTYCSSRSRSNWSAGCSAGGRWRRPLHCGWAVESILKGCPVDHRTEMVRTAAKFSSAPPGCSGHDCSRRFHYVCRGPGGILNVSHSLCVGSGATIGRTQRKALPCFPLQISKEDRTLSRFVDASKLLGRYQVRFVRASNKLPPGAIHHRRVRVTPPEPPPAGIT